MTRCALILLCVVCPALAGCESTTRNEADTPAQLGQISPSARQKETAAIRQQIKQDKARLRELHAKQNAEQTAPQAPDPDGGFLHPEPASESPDGR